MYITSRGIQIEFLPVARETLLKFRAAHPEPKPPTYKIVTATGVEEIHEHDKTTITTDAEKTAYAQYEQAQYDHMLAYLRLFVLRGLKINASMDDWLAEQSFIGMPAAASKAEQRFDWVTDCVLGTPEDYKSVMLGVIQASGVPEELLSQIEATFWGNVQKEESRKAEAPGRVAIESRI